MPNPEKAYILAIKHPSREYYELTTPLRTMSRDQADVCIAAHAIEYPSLADQYLALEVILPALPEEQAAEVPEPEKVPVVQ